MLSKLDKFGRVVIPKPVREDLHLMPGTAFRVKELKGQIVLAPVWEEPLLVRKEGVLVFTGDPTGDLENAVDRHRQGRLHQASAWSES